MLKQLSFLYSSYFKLLGWLRRGPVGGGGVKAEPRCLAPVANTKIRTVYAISTPFSYIVSNVVIGV